MNKSRKETGAGIQIDQVEGFSRENPSTCERRVFQRSVRFKAWLVQIGSL